MSCELDHDRDDNQKQMDLLVVVAVVTEVQAVKALERWRKAAAHLHLWPVSHEICIN